MKFFFAIPSPTPQCGFFSWTKNFTQVSPSPQSGAFKSLLVDNYGKIEIFELMAGGGGESKDWDIEKVILKKIVDSMKIEYKKWTEYRISTQAMKINKQFSHLTVTKYTLK